MVGFIAAIEEINKQNRLPGGDELSLADILIKFQCIEASFEAIGPDLHKLFLGSDPSMVREGAAAHDQIQSEISVDDVIKVAITICYIKLRQIYGEACHAIELFLATVVADISEMFSEEANRLFNQESCLDKDTETHVSTEVLEQQKAQL